MTVRPPVRGESAAWHRMQRRFHLGLLSAGSLYAETGTTLMDLVFAAGIFITATGMAIPVLTTGLNASRTKSAALYMGSRLRAARVEAVRRSRTVGIRFAALDDGYEFSAYADGNGNGIRNAEIRAGIDFPIGEVERLEHQFGGVIFGIARATPGIEGDEGLLPGGDAIRIGRTNILSFTPSGTATPGTLYICGRGGMQYAVRVLGATGRTRVLVFDDAQRRWVTR